MSKNKSILTSDKEHLQLFEDGIAINKDLPKWRRAEAGMEKTEKPSRVNEDIPNSPFNTYSSSVSGSHGTEDSSDVDSNIDVLPGWEGLYRTPYGINFDELAKAEIKNLTRLLVEKKVKYVMGGYGSFGTTVSNATYFDYDSDGYGVKIYESPIRKEEKIGFFKRLFGKKKKVETKKEDKYEFDALKFFSLVKSTSKESAETYKNRVEKYLKALQNATISGQTALQEELLRGLVANKYESLLYSEGLYYVIDEEKVVEFVKKSEKGIALDYVKNFTRPMPQEVIDKIEKANNLEVFDNFVVLHFDPEKKSWKETEAERVKRKDPIVFGVIAGSKKLYYITDWIDETCDLTLDKFVDTLNVDKESFKLEN